MTEGRALPLIFNFTMPLLLGNLLQQTYSLVDTAIVGRYLGIDSLAGCLLRRPYCLDLCGCFPDTGFHFCLSANTSDKENLVYLCIGSEYQNR